MPLVAGAKSLPAAAYHEGTRLEKMDFQRKRWNLEKKDGFSKAVCGGGQRAGVRREGGARIVITCLLSEVINMVVKKS